jgi:hypothetical protein
VEQARVYTGRTPGAIRQLIHKRQVPVVRFGSPAPQENGYGLGAPGYRSTLPVSGR